MSGDRRFANVSEEDLETLKKSTVPENTAYKERWAMKIFREWYVKWRSDAYKDLEDLSVSDLDVTLQNFISSLRKVRKYYIVHYKYK